MKKLKAKYTYRQALDLCCFMDGIDDLKIGIYRDRPSIIISDQDDLENFRELEDNVFPMYYSVFIKNLNDSVKMLDEIMEFLFNNHNLVVYDTLRISPKVDQDENQRESCIRFPIENESGKEFVLFSPSINRVLRKRKNKGNIK